MEPSIDHKGCTGDRTLLEMVPEIRRPSGIIHFGTVHEIDHIQLSGYLSVGKPPNKKLDFIMAEGERDFQVATKL